MTQLFAKAMKQAQSHNEHNDCAVKAIAIVCRVSYKTAHAALRKFGRRDGTGTQRIQTSAAISSLGFTVTKVTTQPRQKNGSRYTPKSVGKGFPCGSNLVFFNGHVAAMKRGTVEDWTNGRRHYVQSVWRVMKIK